MGWGGGKGRQVSTSITPGLVGQQREGRGLGSKNSTVSSFSCQLWGQDKGALKGMGVAQAGPAPANTAFLSMETFEPIGQEPLSQANCNKAPDPASGLQDPFYAGTTFP